MPAHRRRVADVGGVGQQLDGVARAPDDVIVVDNASGGDDVRRIRAAGHRTGPGGHAGPGGSSHEQPREQEEDER